jgi:hypothetical protein
VDEMVIESGNVTFVLLPASEGNVILKAKNMVPAQTKNYRISVTNNGVDCKVFFGLSDIQNPIGIIIT